MKSRLLLNLGIITGLMLGSLTPAFAQSEAGALPTAETERLTAIISGPTEVGVGQTLLLDSFSSRNLGEDATYQWLLKGKPISESAELVYTPQEKGVIAVQLIILSTVNGKEERALADHTVIAYERKITLIAEESVPQDKLDIHKELALETGVYLRVVKLPESSTPIAAEESYRKVLTENLSALDNAQTIVLWADGTPALHALMQALEADSDRIEALKNQTIVLITNQSLATLSRTARGPFSVLQPDHIIVTRKEAINPLISATGVDEFEVEITKRDIDFMIVNKASITVRPWNLLSSLVNYMIAQGISSQIVILLLILPVIATILAFLKQVVGITTYGLYTPSILALSFLALGWGLGFFFLIFILVTGYLTRSLMKRWRILYIPKVAILLTVVSLTLLVLLAIASSRDILFGRDTIFILLIMSTLAESLLNVQREEGWYNAILGMSETILAALLCVIIVKWSLLQSVILAYPETILLTIFINIIIGRFTGLRVIEYFRFREVFKHQQEE